MHTIITTLVQTFGFFLIFGSVIYANYISSDNTVYYYFLHIPSFILVFVGLIGALLSIRDYKENLSLIKELLRESPSKIRRKMDYIKENFKDFTETYYINSNPTIVKNYDQTLLPSIWKNTLIKLEAKVPIDDIKFIITKQFHQEVANYQKHIKTLKILKSLAPSLGMFGTVLGLVKMLSDLSDFSTIGPNMSLALITTLYGSFATILFEPVIAHIENKLWLKTKTTEELIFWLHIIRDRMPVIYLENTK